MKTFVHWFCKSNSEFMICRVLLILDNCVFDEKKKKKKFLFGHSTVFTLWTLLVTLHSTVSETVKKCNIATHPNFRISLVVKMTMQV